MKTTIRLSLITVLTLICALTSIAQEQTPSIEVTTDNDRAQFAVQGQAQAVHIEVFSPAGELVFETDAFGQAAEWRMVNDKGKRVADGVYLATITVTDFLGKRRKRIEQIVVSSETQEKQTQDKQTLAAETSSPYAIGPISGQGTPGRLSKFTGVNAIGNSVVTESANKVGVNISPTATLQVNAVQPAPLAANGAAATTLLQTIGGKGGNTTVGGGKIAGAGASLSLVAGNGGDAPAGSTRGKGGNITLQPGSTGAGAGRAGSNGNVLIAPSGIGNVGIGATANPFAKLHVNGGVGSAVNATSSNGVGVNAESGSSAGVVGKSTSSVGVFGQSLGSSYGVYGISNSGPGVVAESSTGNLVEGRIPAGRQFHITNSGTYVAGSDFAEALSARGDRASYEPGDVLVASAKAPGKVEKASRTYDPRVAGVYSTRPGMLGADKNGTSRVDADEVPVAIVGIVPTKVSAVNGPIRVGDLLTTSSTPGYAMRCANRGKCVGAIVGKALEPLGKGKGIIKMLVMLR